MPGNWYSTACKHSVNYFGWLVGDLERFKKKSETSVSQEFLDSLNFCGFEIEPYESQILAISGALISFIVLIVMDLVFFNFMAFGFTTIIFMVLTTLLIPSSLLLYLSEYPKIHARFEKIHSLGDIPEILSYVVMSMKLVSNMERAISFAAANSDRPLARDLRKLIWDMHVRVYTDIDDALIAFANQWGKNSEYFKRALYLVKSSTNEPDEAQRVMTLNKSLDIVLEGTRHMMEGFAARLKSPTYVLYSIFILIPLALVALLPAVSIVGVRINTVTIILLYDLVLPLATFAYAEYILLQRPAAFSPPNIPDEHPRLVNIRSTRHRTMILSVASAALIGASGYIWLQLGNPGGLVSTGVMTGYVPVSFPLIWGLTALISIYAFRVYVPYKNIRDDIKEIERQFADALFVLGRRISEGRSPEWAFMQTAQTMKGTGIGEAFQDVAQNISFLRTTLAGAIFDQEYGAFRNIYSERVHTTMRLFTESVYKSHEAAGVAIVKLADHLKELQEVEDNIKSSLYDVTSTMKTTATIFAPLIAGVTLALSEVIQKILQSISHQASRLPDDISISSIMSDVGGGMEQSIPPDVFILSVGFYIIILVVILVRFAGGIEYGGDKPQFMYELGKGLPLSILVFTISMVISRTLFAAII
jgi:Flp pilus assembly protein TadB